MAKRGPGILSIGPRGFLDESGHSRMRIREPRCPRIAINEEEDFPMWFISMLRAEPDRHLGRANSYQSHSGRRWRSRRLRHRPVVESLEDRTAPAVLFTVNSLDDGPVNLGDDALTLRDALFAANSGDEIDFEPSLFATAPGTITLDPSQGQLNIRTDLTISGPGADLLTIDAHNGSRIFNIEDSAPTHIDVEIHGLTLTGGNADL